MFKGQIYVNEKTFMKLRNNINYSSSLANGIITNAKIIKY